MYFVSFSWLHALVHIVATIIQIGPYHLALHVSSHRKVFKSDYLNDYWLPIVVGPFFGQTFYTYFLHHIKMHHVADNSPEDTSSTLFYQRDNIFHFLHYFGRFYYLVWYELTVYFMKHNQKSRGLMALGCEALSMTLFGTLSYFNFYPMLVCVWVPFNLSRLFMMSGNWTQHAFLNRESPLGGGLSNSITIISTRFNALCFNDGYHASHHLNAHRHWTEHPRTFLANRSIYENAIVLQNTDYEEMFFCLMTHWYERIASKMVDNVGIGAKITSIEGRVAWLKERTKQFTLEEVEAAKGKKGGVEIAGDSDKKE
ncbi:fatty acid desaturase-domain-containing protein [Chytriomyces cf. hyalinus JEL632]|nr:fatty acid desaturase-domain-containing protein [Chytriomyces cf. hyalinus JEL632]